jgi:hypothetical protein
MPMGEALYLGMVVGAFVIFAAALAWVANNWKAKSAARRAADSYPNMTKPSGDPAAGAG